jgi:hypothetical protein
MKRLFILNPLAVYRKKNGVYALYIDFNYIFFTDQSAELLDKMFEVISFQKCLDFLPDSFLDYLVSKKIILEEKQ